jgi:hypothetical protein
MRTVVTRFNKLSMIAVALAMLGTSYTAASAETLWQYNHPRREQVNDRLANQNYRIHQEAMEGELPPGQAAQLHAEDHAIRTEERTMASFNGGHITPYEQHLLNAQENGVSHQIGY